ncbi:MAG TPA: hypothetical protein VGE63_01850 [Candidatus Paceibacterota bacterium]
MKKKLIYLVVAVVLLGLVTVLDRSLSHKVAQTTEQADATMEITKLVAEFGNHLKNVPTTANPALIPPLVDQEYRPYITDALYDRWMNDPMSVPGRATSSPWPDRMEVKDIKPAGDHYEVVADVVEVTSVEAANGGAAVRSTVYLTVVQVDGVWKIAEYQTSME